MMEVLCTCVHHTAVCSNLLWWRYCALAYIIQPYAAIWYDGGTVHLSTSYSRMWQSVMMEALYTWVHHTAVCSNLLWWRYCTLEYIIQPYVAICYDGGTVHLSTSCSRMWQSGMMEVLYTWVKILCDRDTGHLSTFLQISQNSIIYIYIYIYMWQ